MNFLDNLGYSYFHKHLDIKVLALSLNTLEDGTNNSSLSQSMFLVDYFIYYKKYYDFIMLMFCCTILFLWLVSVQCCSDFQVVINVYGSLLYHVRSPLIYCILASILMKLDKNTAEPFIITYYWVSRSFDTNATINLNILTEIIGDTLQNWMVMIDSYWRKYKIDCSFCHKNS